MSLVCNCVRFPSRCRDPLALHSKSISIYFVPIGSDLPAICSLFENIRGRCIVLVGKYFDIFRVLILEMVGLKDLLKSLALNQPSW